MILKGKRVLLRKYRSSDIDALASIANNFTIYSNLRDGFPHPYKREDAEAWIKSVTGEDPKNNVFAIEYMGELAGSIGLGIKDDIYRLNGEVGYFIAEQFWGMGLASEAVGLITAYGFEKFGLERIYAEPFAHNGASRRVLEKAGYTHEATLRNYVIKNNEILDSCIYSILKADYQATVAK